MRGDNIPAVYWVSPCRGNIELCSVTPLRMLGCLDIGSEWCFQAKHVNVAANTLADGISL